MTDTMATTHASRDDAAATAQSQSPFHVDDNVSSASAVAGGSLQRRLSQGDADRSSEQDNQKETFKHEYPHGYQLYCILIPVTMAYFLFFLDIAIVSTATPAITVTFDSLVDVGWYVLRMND